MARALVALKLSPRIKNVAAFAQNVATALTNVTVRRAPHLRGGRHPPSHRGHGTRAQVAGMVVEDGVAVAA